MIECEFTALFPFCGLGAGARGFLDAQVSLLGRVGRFRSLGGIDFDPLACADFEMLTDSPSLCTDIARLSPAALRAFAGPVAPDVVFMSPPCKSASGLLSKSLSRTPKYEAMTRLALDWTELMLATWTTPPKLVLLENVPRLKSRAPEMLRDVCHLLRAAGVLTSEGFHDCGELGGLAQHRKRFLLVGRDADRVPPLLYQAPKKRVRACGEVLGTLPMPGDPTAGPMHQLPRISWLNWVRLAMIPAGGDWRDLPGVLEGGQARREVFRRHHVQTWTEPAATVAGSGSNGPCAVADPRVVGMATDNPGRHHNKYVVSSWDDPSRTVIGATRPGSGALSVADPRAASWFPGALGVVPWMRPTGTVTANGRPGAGAFSVADPRVRRAFDHGYAVLPWTAPSFTVAGQSLPGCGAYTVADPRLVEAASQLGCTPRAGAYGVIPWTEAAKTVTGAACFDNGAFAVADPRWPESPVMVIEDIRKPPPAAPVILAEDGTWHRPLTTLELAVLQGLPPLLRGKPLQLAGKSASAHRERIGNAVPPPTARAIAEQMLVTLVSAEAGGFSLSAAGGVWVEPQHEVA